MKKILVLSAMFLFSTGFAFQQVTAQQKAKTESEKEKAFQQAIDEQKKAMTDQKLASDEQKKKIEELVKNGLITGEEGQKELFLQQEKLNELLEEVNVMVESGNGRYGDAVRIYSPRGRRVETFTIPSPPDAPGAGAYFGQYFSGDIERTTWDFSKSVKENTFSGNYSFGVDKTAKNVVMSVSGDCKAGEIRIKIVMPDGKNYSDIVIDEFGNLNWRKSFTISETENQDKTGDWKFQVASKKATGYFKISIQSY